MKIENEALRIQKHYLGTLFSTLTKEDVEKLDKVFNRRLKTMYLKGKKAFLRKVATYLLLSRGEWVEYRYFTSSELLGSWLGKDVSGDGQGQRTFHLDLRSPILILHHLKYSVENVALESLICQQISERDNLGLITLVLDEGNLEEVRLAMKDSGLFVRRDIVDCIFDEEKAI